MGKKEDSEKVSGLRRLRGLMFNYFVGLGLAELDGQNLYDFINILNKYLD